jgi:hypothetical protein
MADTSPLARSILREVELVELVEQYLHKMLGVKDVIQQPNLGHGARPDLMATLPNGQTVIVEVRGVTPNTQARLSQVVDKLNRYADLYQEKYGEEQRPELILAIPGTLSPQHLNFLRHSGITGVIDGLKLAKEHTDPRINGAFSAILLTEQPRSLKSQANALLSRLDRVTPGREGWSTYQTLCGDLLEFLLCPPLSTPLRESSNTSKVNRKDIVFPNYATTGFWDFMRAHYSAHYVIVDAKNYKGEVSKNAILQVANYLSAHGAGLFAIISCRSAGDRSAEITRREQWAVNGKMILTINDGDLRQMISNKASGADPSDVLRQKIEDFRLGF